MSDPAPPSGPDLTRGVAMSELPDGGMLLGQAAGEAVLLVRCGNDVHAVAAACSHYNAPLVDGVLVGCELRCPYHHARFDARTGAVTGPPAPRPLDTWDVLREAGRVRVGAKRPAAGRPPAREGPRSVVIVGAGAAGDAAAAVLRSEGYRGPVTMIGRDDESVPIDRPNLSKDYLAGTAPEEWLPIRGDGFYAAQDITLITGVAVSALDPARHEVALADGRILEYGALLLATGAEPIRLELPGSTRPHVFTLRTLDDTRAIAGRAAAGGAAVVIGASFIGLEAAASLRQRGLEVVVVGPEARPHERVLGPQVGDFVRGLHEAHGVRFQLGRKPAAIGETDVTLDDGTRLPAGLVVMGVGVRPRIELAQVAGLAIDRGVVVDEMLRTSAADVFAAGDIARFPVRGTSWRIEHWVVAQQQGGTAARNMLGMRESYRSVPFFWSQHYDVPINYVGHAEAWDRIDVAGDLEARDALVAYRSGGRITAIATVYRDRDSLRAEEAFARDDQGALERLLSPVRT